MFSTKPKQITIDGILDILHSDKTITTNKSFYREIEKKSEEEFEIPIIRNSISNLIPVLEDRFRGKDILWLGD